MNHKDENLLVNNRLENEKLYNGRIMWIELLRILACFCVILWHVSAKHVQNISNGPAIWYVFVFFNTLARCSVPIFVMISGLLYLDSSKKISIKKIYSENILRILFIYIFWCIFYGFSNIIINSGYTGQGVMIFKEAIKNAITKPNYHLWYLPTLVGLLVVTPIFREVFSKGKSKKMCEYTLIVLFTLRILKITILAFNIPKIEYVRGMLNIVNLEAIGGDCIFYFIAGYYFFNYEISKRWRKIIYILGGVAFISGMTLTIYVSTKNGKFTTEFYKNNAVFIVLYSISVFVFFKSIVSKINVSNKVRNIILNISSCTLGIYLIHPLFNDIIFSKLKINLLEFNSIITILLTTVVNFMISFLVTNFLKKIKICKWNIV